MRRFLLFALTVAVAHTVTYLVVGGISYQLLTRDYYVGDNPIFATFMRTETDPELWAHVLKWFLPGQIVRGILIAVALFPFLDVINTWSFQKRTLSIAGLYLIIGFWAMAGAAPGTIEGLIYLRPEISYSAHFKVQAEIIIQGLLMATLIAWRTGIKGRSVSGAASVETVSK